MNTIGPAPLGWRPSNVSENPRFEGGKKKKADQKPPKKPDRPVARPLGVMPRPKPPAKPTK